ncbi:unnamed protein product [Aphanomyces euteiches]
MSTIMKFENLSTPSPFAKSSLIYPIIGGYEPNHIYFERDYYPAYEILLIGQGKGALRQGETWIEFGKGDCLLHDMRYPHAYRSDSLDPCGMWYLVFDGIDLEPLWSRLFDDTITLFTAGGPNCPVELTLRTILEGMEETELSNEWRQSALLYELLMHSARLVNRDRSIVQKPENIEQARRYMDASYQSITSVREVAKEASLSLYHFIRQFNKYFGYTPNDYLLLKKINHAKRMLTLTDASVNEVYEQSGFESYNAFLQAFRKLELCSPSTFRKNWKRN